ncbi:MAG TPA: hypothetical protein ENJ38_08360 [Rhodospirillales bacterium]|nr:hypothetical protein [Rhodospirillales bacterium]
MAGTEDLQAIRFNVLRNALYHQARRRFLERVSRILNFAIIMLGTGAVAAAIPRFGVSAWIGVAVAAIGALQLVYDFSRRAAEHASLQRDYFRLLAEIEEKETADPGDIARWRAAMLRLSADEPPVLKAVDAIAYNAAADAMELPEGERLLVPMRVKAIAHLFGFDDHRFVKRAEVV